MPGSMRLEPAMLARRFLWIVAGITILVIVGAILYRIFAVELMRFVMVPKVEYSEVPLKAGSTYADRDMWIARPDIPNNPSQWLPPGVERGSAAPRASVFFIHPTSFLESSAWNAALDDRESQQRAALFVRSQASAFNGVGEIWAPKYRQAAFGAFLTTQANAQRALDLAYRDVAAAYDEFLREAPRDRPIILAGHSQGSLHLMRLLAERVAGSPEARRIAAAYVVGWPVSTTVDLPRLGLPACARAGQSGCILSWQSFGEPADPKMVTDAYDESRGPNGEARAGTRMLCVNPLTGNAGDAAGADRNLGTLIPNEDFSEAEYRRRAVPARCDVRGLLLIGQDPPEFGEYVLPGNNYHVFDYSLFWANTRADAEARLDSFLAR
jgi:pimeloyl-ACP methyl ester carboxylesterase